MAGLPLDQDPARAAVPRKSHQQLLFRCLGSLPRPATVAVLVTTVILIGTALHGLCTAQVASPKSWTPDPGVVMPSPQGPLPAPAFETSFISDNYSLPLRTLGAHVVDQNGRRFRLQSINWYGASDELFVPGGLDVQHRSTIAGAIRRMGFNSVRLPYSDELVLRNPAIPARLVAANPDLAGRPALDVFAAVAGALTDAGLAVVVNNHITRATWCCGADPCDAGWRNDHLPSALCRVRQTEAQWIAHWEAVMRPLARNPRVIGADLRNEPRGLWGTMTWDAWAAAAERAGDALLRLNPGWLVVVEGTSSSNDLSGVARRPVRLLANGTRDRVVYSAHVYSWSGWGTCGGRYSRRGYASFARAMRANWAYLVESGLAPVWLGEFGAPSDPSGGDANYWRNLVRFLGALEDDWGYWALNPSKPHDGARESYSLVQADWITPLRDDYRLRDLAGLMGSGGIRDARRWRTFDGEGDL